MSLFSSVCSPEATVPFTITPIKTTIPPYETTSFLVTFAPPIAAKYIYRLGSNIMSLNPKMNELCIPIEAESVVPKFYFDLEEYHYPFVKARQKDNVKVLGFEAVGFGVKCETTLILVNNHLSPVSFKFESLNKDVFSCFACKTPSGDIQASKKYEVVFYFVPHELGTIEESYIFSLNGGLFATNFLLIGLCREPKVAFTVPHVTMPPTVCFLESKKKVVLRNEENIELHFKILKSSIIFAKEEMQVKVFPMSGKLLPKSELPIQLTVMFPKPGSTQLALTCAIEKIHEPINLNVSASCLEVVTNVYYHTLERRFDLSPDEDNVIDFGNLPLQKKYIFKLTLENIGEAGFFYSWQFNKTPIERTFDFSVSKPTFVGSMSCAASTMYITPLRRAVLKDFKMALQLFYEVHYNADALCLLRGSCTAPDFSLDKNILAFPNVVIGYTDTKSVLLRNFGDTDGRYKWSLEEPFLNVFVIKPDEGYIKRNTERKMNVTFAPKTLECQFTNKLVCTFDDSPPLELLLIGGSLSIPKVTDTLKFTCPVREHAVQFINITNPTKDLWKISTETSSQHFLVSREIDIPAETTQPIGIKYVPQNMTKHGPHEDTLYVYLPEEQLRLYQLVGTTLPPLPAQKISVLARCKENHVELLNIENKRNTKQSFRITTALLSTPTIKTMYKIHGLEFMEILPYSSKNYRWNICVLHEEPMEFRVKFTDVDTEEYLYFDISLEVLPSAPMDTMNFKTRVRQLLEFSVKLMNPVDVPVTFIMSCNVPQLIFPKTVSIAPYCTHHLPVTYYPLSDEEISATLNASCEELGTFIYAINMEVEPPLMEKVVSFEAEIGGKCTKPVKFTNSFPAPLQFTAKFDHQSFSVEKLAEIPSGQTVALTFIYEPSELGTTKGTGTFTSLYTGEYNYPLIGTCTPPTPKGPIFVKLGSQSSIPFTNPFLEEHRFLYTLESTYFTLNTDAEDLTPKKSTKIVISVPNLKKTEVDFKYPVTGKLIVSCDEEELKDVKWIFYIQSEV